jgi:catechol 2,3-dioxygenase-like lactoylglutathione lyase family enzyme
VSSEFVRGVDFVGIPTHDIAAASAFYADTLGLPRSVYIPERHFSEYETGNLTLSVYDAEAMGMEHRPNPNPVALQVHDVATADGNALMLHDRYAPRQTDN